FEAPEDSGVSVPGVAKVATPLSVEADAELASTAVTAATRGRATPAATNLRVPLEDGALPWRCLERLLLFMSTFFRVGWSTFAGHMTRWPLGDGQGERRRRRLVNLFGGVLHIDDDCVVARGDRFCARDA